MNYSPNGPHDDSQIVSLLSREQYFWFPSDSFLLDYPLLIWLHAKDMTIIFFFLILSGICSLKMRKQHPDLTCIDAGSILKIDHTYVSPK